MNFRSFAKKIDKVLQKYPALYFSPLIFSFIKSLQIVSRGEFSFWYDNARDLLAASHNLISPTLIGPPTGIPGVFYGPYWIWLLSASMVISRDPRWITLVVETLPYFVLFPFLLLKFRKTLPMPALALAWVCFGLTGYRYFTTLWNPNPIPLLFLWLVGSMFSLEFVLTRRDWLKTLWCGFLAGILFNFSMSFGLVVVVSSTAYMFITQLWLYRITKQKTIMSLCYAVGRLFVFLFGLSVAFIPFFLFEFRHGFNQIHAGLRAVAQSVFYNSAVVGQKGFTPQLIVQYFFGRFADLLHLPTDTWISVVIFSFIGVITVFSLVTKRIRFDKKEMSLVLYIGLVGSVLLTIYTRSKNPVWDYHFIGMEILSMLFLALILKKFRWLMLPLALWLVFLICRFQITDIVTIYGVDPLKIGGYSAKKHVVEQIVKDAKSVHASAFAYSPSLYTFEYDYLFQSLPKDKAVSQNREDISKSTYIYLIIPETSKAVKEDFINYMTPNEAYNTVSVWKEPDKTEVYKRIHLP